MTSSASTLWPVAASGCAASTECCVLTIVHAAAATAVAATAVAATARDKPYDQAGIHLRHVGRRAAIVLEVVAYIMLEGSPRQQKADR